MFACQKLLSVANLYTRRIDACCINSTLYMYITIDVSTIKWLLLAAGLQSVVGWKRKLHATVKFWLRVDAEIDSLCNCVCEICDILLNNNCQNMPKMKFVNISNIKKILIFTNSSSFLVLFCCCFFLHLKLVVLCQQHSFRVLFCQGGKLVWGKFQFYVLLLLKLNGLQSTSSELMSLTWISVQKNPLKKMKMVLWVWRLCSTEI